MEPVELDAKGRRARVRFARAEDAAPILEIDRAVVSDGRGVVQDLADLPKNAVDQHSRLAPTLDGPPDRGAYFVAEVEIGGQWLVVGSASVHRFRPAYCRHAATLALQVHPSYQRLGLGRALLQRILDWVDFGPGKGVHRLELHVRADNDRAHALYLSMGFEKECVRRRFVRLPDGSELDDWVMSRLS